MIQRAAGLLLFCRRITGRRAVRAGAGATGSGVVGWADAPTGRAVTPEPRMVPAGATSCPSRAATISSQVWYRSAGTFWIMVRTISNSRRSSGVSRSGSGIGSMMCL
jgi:hypothetical protein